MLTLLKYTPLIEDNSVWQDSWTGLVVLISSPHWVSILLIIISLIIFLNVAQNLYNIFASISVEKRNNNRYLKRDSTIIILTLALSFIFTLSVLYLASTAQVALERDSRNMRGVSSEKMMDTAIQNIKLKYNFDDNQKFVQTFPTHDSARYFTIYDEDPNNTNVIKFNVNKLTGEPAIYNDTFDIPLKPETLEKIIR